MNESRHWFVIEPLMLSSVLAPLAASAEQFEQQGNWFLAGETYHSLQKISAGAIDAMSNAKLLARAASCFEIAGDSHAAARFYEEASREVATTNTNPHLAAELSNRAALQFRESREFFFAGTAWTRAAEEFEKIQATVVKCSENLAPLPMSAFKSHLCGSCFEAAAAVYEQALGNEMWAAGTYWRAGKAYAEGPPNIQAFDAYRRSLVAQIKYYSTLELDQLRRSTPLTERERQAMVNPIEVMEAALARCNNHHQERPGVTRTSTLQTEKQMAATFHKFSVEFQAIGNTAEAGKFRAAQNERQRRVHMLERNYGAAMLYLLWRTTSGYGESLGRWAFTCLLVIAAFAIAYAVFGVIAPASGDQIRGFDYIYFSVVTFSTLGYGDIHPVGLLGQIFACLEVFAGLIMFGVLLSFVGSRFQR